MLVITLVSGLVLCLSYALRKYRVKQWGHCTSTRNMDGKVVVITGASSGIGKETARELAKRGAIVILACRFKVVAQVAVDDIRRTTKNGDLIIVQLDLSDFSSIRNCATKLNEKFNHIDMLINNAGVYVPPDMERTSTSGFEVHFGVNHLGHFLFTKLLLGKLAKTNGSRLIIVSSQLYKTGEIDLERLKSTAVSKTSVEGRKGRNPLYSDSKLCNILHGQELSRRLEGTGTSVFVVCPGFAYTGLMREVMDRYNVVKLFLFTPIALFFMRSSNQAAQTSVHCTVSEELDGVPFGFYANCKEAALCTSAATDPDLAARLYRLSNSLISKDQ